MIDLDHFASWTMESHVKYNGTRLSITPDLSFNAWGDPIIATMLMLAGITHCKFKIVARNKNPYA